MYPKNLWRATSFSISLGMLTINTIAQTPVSNKPNTAIQAPASSQAGSLPAGYSGGVLINYVRTKEAMGAFTDETIFNSQSYQHVKEATQYIDGIGRPLQTVLRQITPGSTPKDMVTPTVYDAFGREIYKYLPYVQSSGSNTADGTLKLNPFTDQNHFYKNVYKDANNDLMLPGENFFYGKTDVEASPLNRILKTMTPGNSWAGSNKGLSQQYLVNTPADLVRNWNIGLNVLNYSNDDATNIPTTSSEYSTGELYKTVRLDEHTNAVVEFKDKEGQVILKKVQIGTIASDYSGYDGFLCTYYVYDDFNRLRFVIPPKAVEAVKTNWVFNPTIISELCFRYEYDSRGRMIAKKTPGAGWVYLIYDQRDRLVLSQDANMKLQDWWMLTLYDQLNRPVMTARTTYNGTPADLQDYVNGLPLVSSSAGVAGANNPSGLSADPAFNVRETGRDLYQATSSISFEEGFVSESGAEFVTEIVSPSNSTFNETVPILGQPIPPNSGLYPLTITHYDEYQWTDKTYDPTNNSKLDIGNNLHDESVPSTSSLLTRGMVTGTRVVVLEDPANSGSGPWLTTVNFYDDKGRSLQSQHQNYKGGVDIMTSRYNFSGNLISTYEIKNNPLSSIANYRVKSSMEYDHVGRLIEIKKQINDDITTSRTIVKNEYDDLGQLKRKSIGQKRNSDGTLSSTEAIETLDYNYNIRGWLTGINKKYSRVGLTNDKWFGMELNYDWGFDNSQYNGNISGTRWRSKGDGEYRSYGFSYDKANRLLGADFAQAEGGSYGDNTKNTNFDMIMGDGQNASIAYDPNGNIKAMKQWGLKLGSSVNIDDMVYTYHDNTNKLRGVAEQGTGATDHKLGDFTNKNATADDYGYDQNGNLITDLNKRLNGNIGLNQNSGAIVYNHLNLPSKITIKTDDGTAIKGTITYIYDAVGTKLEKRVHEYAVSTNPEKKTNTTYLSGFIFEDEKLQFFGHEEGRTRQKIENGQITFNYDYFLKDHLGNVRIVLTDEVEPPAIYQAGMETAQRNFEVALFGDKINSTVVNKPAGFDNDGSNEKVSQVNGTTAERRVGPGVVLKVMAGDKIKARTYAWFQPVGMDGDKDPGLGNIVTNLLSNLLPGILGVAKGSAGEQVTNAILQPGMQAFLNEQNPAAAEVKAHLNWVLLDEEYFQPVEGNYGSVQMPQITGAAQKQLLQANAGGEIEMKKNGYIYVYVSNESKGNVYFDDIRVEHIKGPLLEETHYYPFGLTMAGISSKAIGKLENKKNKFEGQELNDDFDVNYYEFKYRTHDPQIGRFIQIDPLADKYVYNSPYAFSENKVTGDIELEGLETASANDINNPRYRALLRESVQEKLSAADKNIRQAGSIKVGVGPGLGGSIKAGDVSFEAGVSGPTGEVKITPEQTTAQGSLASGVVKVKTPFAEAQIGTTIGSVKYENGEVSTDAGNTHAKASITRETGEGNTSGKLSGGSTGEIGVGAKIGIVAVEITVAPVKLVNALIGWAQALVEYTKESAKEVAPNSPYRKKDYDPR